MQEPITLVPLISADNSFALIAIIFGAICSQFMGRETAVGPIPFQYHLGNHAGLDFVKFKYRSLRRTHLSDDQYLPCSSGNTLTII